MYQLCSYPWNLPKRETFFFSIFARSARPSSRHRLRFGLQSLDLAQKDSLPLLMISSTTLFWVTRTRDHFVIHVIQEKRRKLQ
jgi:hypothetical protein